MNSNLSFLILSFLLIFGSAIPLKAQSFPTYIDQARWEMNTFAIIPIDLEKIFTGDTIQIAGTPWTSIYRSYHYLPDPDAPAMADTILQGYYRVAGEQVYFRTPGLPGSVIFREGLLYDFSLEVGDSSYLLAPNSIPVDSVLYFVTAVDSFLCNEQWQKRMSVRFDFTPYNISYQTTWITGIGDTYHPFLPTTCIEPVCEVFYTGTTLYLNGKVILAIEEEPCVSLTSAADPTPHPEETLIRIYPNPADELLHLFLPIAQNGEYHIQFHSGTGQLMYQNKVWSGAVEALDISQWPPGLYYYQLLKRGKSLTRGKVLVH